MATDKLTDLPDSEKDKAKLEPEEAILDLPDVSDIPGQENIHVPELREMADTTIASDDEEGKGIFGDDDAEFDTERLAVGEEVREENLTIRGEDGSPETQVDPAVEAMGMETDDLDITDDAVGEEADVTDEEREALERTEQMYTQDNENLYRSELDDTDLDGEKLNEDDELDVPGAEEDDANEEIGEEDEENNAYSLGDTA